MRIVNAPGRYTASPQALAGDVARWVSVQGVHAVFLTEVASRARGDAIAPAAGPDWTVTRSQGSGTDIGRGECAVLTRNAHYTKILARRFVKVWDGGGRARLAHPIYVPIVVARTASGHVDVLTGCHTPAHVEGLWAHLPMPDRFKARILLRRNRSRIQTYLKVLHAWRLATMQIAAEFHADDVIAAPDGNLDAHKPWVRELLHRAWPGMHLAATKDPDLGKRTVGWVLTTMTPGPSHVEKAKASDHDAGVYTLARTNQVPATTKPPKGATPPPPFTRCTYNGAGMDEFTKAALQTLEAGPLKDLAPLTVLQGCWHPGVGASAGTHDRSGVLDLAPFEYGRKVKAWRDNLGPDWHRPAVPGLWGEHIHGVISSCTELAPVAAAQIPAYYAGQDGLADHARDPNQHHPHVAFNYETAWHELNA
jgi:hypothetical protein